MNEQSPPWWRSSTKLPFAVFLAIGAYFLWTEHQAHIIEFLPWVLVLGCVGMHLFMHGGHGHGGGHKHGERAGPSAGDSDEEGPPR